MTPQLLADEAPCRIVSADNLSNNETGDALRRLIAGPICRIQCPLISTLPYRMSNRAKVLPSIAVDLGFSTQLYLGGYITFSVPILRLFRLVDDAHHFVDM